MAIKLILFSFVLVLWDSIQLFFPLTQDKREQESSLYFLSNCKIDKENMAHNFFQLLEIPK